MKIVVPAPSHEVEPPPTTARLDCTRCVALVVVLLFRLPNTTRSRGPPFCPWVEGMLARMTRFSLGMLFVTCQEKDMVCKRVMQVLYSEVARVQNHVVRDRRAEMPAERLQCVK